jgi:hypothetical protein
MSIQFEPTTDPNWDHLRAMLARARAEQPKPRNYWRVVEIVALAIVVIGLGVLVRMEASDAPKGAIAYAIEQFELQVTQLEEQAVGALRERVVKAEPRMVKPSPKVTKPKHTSMAEPATESNPAGNLIRVEERVRQLPKFQLEIVEQHRRRIVNAADKHMMLEIAEPGAMSAAGDEPVPARFEPVVLRAHINKDGGIETLEKMSGPSALTTAAIETVKGLHYQPVYRNGSAVDTETEITVNFVPAK